MENKFTDRFLRVPLYVVKSYEEDAMGKDAPKQKITGRINPDSIIAYFPDFAEKGEEPKTAVCLSDGSSHCVRMQVQDFETLLDDFKKPTSNEQ